jgi:molybdenum cofactor cytidylyltransferase
MASLPPADAVLLAAGRSSRMGEPKGLVVVRGRRWVEHQIDAALAAGCGRVVVVLGHDRAEYERALPELGRRADVVVNPDPDRGPFSSLQAGLGQIAPLHAAFVLPVDVPAASPDVWAALAQEMTGGVQAVVPVLQGRGGHPVLLAPQFVAALLGRPATSRLDAELRALIPALVTPGTTPRLVRREVHDPRILLNLNAPEDWRKLEQDG